MTCAVFEQELIGYHGTYSLSVGSIFATNFNASNAPTEWLGHGIYFFVEGVGDPVTHARSYIYNKSKPDKGLCVYRKGFSVIRACIKSNLLLLDVRTNEGKNFFNELKEAIIKKHDSYFTKNRQFENDICFIWNMVAENADIDVIINDLYIKNEIERIKKISSNVPNCTVMCVKSSENIRMDSFNVIHKGYFR